MKKITTSYSHKDFYFRVDYQCVDQQAAAHAQQVGTFNSDNKRDAATTTTTTTVTSTLTPGKALQIHYSSSSKKTLSGTLCPHTPLDR